MNLLVSQDPEDGGVRGGAVHLPMNKERGHQMRSLGASSGEVTWVSHDAPRPSTSTSSKTRSYFYS